MVDRPVAGQRATQLAVSGRTGADVVQVTAPDITDVTSLGAGVQILGQLERVSSDSASSRRPTTWAWS